MPERQEGDKSKEPGISRLQKLRDTEKDQTFEPELPPTIGGEYLLAYLWEVGPTIAAGMGQAPISWQEIAAWESRVGIELQPWEAQALRRLSIDYLHQSHKAEKRDCPPPWRDAEPFVRASATKSLQQSLRALANKS